MGDGVRLTRLVFGFAATFSLVFAAMGADEPAQRVVIVYNETVPDSKRLAEYYAQKRGVPTNQLCAIRAPDADTINRLTFIEEVREPILRFLTRNSLIVQQPTTINDPVLGPVPTLRTVDSKISYIVLMYGVPLRIESDPTSAGATTNKSPQQVQRDEASVESDLTTMLTLGLPLSGWVRNPFYNNRLTEFDAPLNSQMSLVGRLDGPEPGVVRRMIDDALTAERFGLQGRAYFDARGITDQTYGEGDAWVKASYQLFRDAGFECELDEQSDVFNEDYPMTDAAVYAGWYAENVSGPFTREDFRFQTGAMTCHIHSWSGASLRTRTSNWVGPLLGKGAAAALGNVYEPYLGMTPRLHVFFKRLLDGAMFLEAAYYSQPVLSWQTTFVGDPLYRPFAIPLDEQIARLEQARRPELVWAYIRKINLLMLQGEAAEAERLCRVKAEALGSIALWEKHGDLLRTTGRAAEAIDLYKRLLAGAPDLPRRIRLTTKLAAAYERNGKLNQAMATYEAAAGLVTTEKNAREYYQKARELAMTLGDQAKVRFLSAKLDTLNREPKK